MNWLDEIVEITMENYGKRKIVIWGKYDVSEKISELLKREYHIETECYVDNNPLLIDNDRVYLPQILTGRSKEFYVIIPLAVYDEIRSHMISGGYVEIVDYYYFSDCCIKKTDCYYEDKHGNRIVGNRNRLKFCFSGYNAEIIIGDGVQIMDSVMYLHNNSEVEIGCDCKLNQTKVSMCDDSRIKIDCDCKLNQTKVSMCDDSRLKIEQGCEILSTVIGVGDWSKVEVNEEAKICNNVWSIHKHASLTIGYNSFFDNGRLLCCPYSRFNIGNSFSVNSCFYFMCGEYTSIDIGDDCMFSHSVMMRSDDGHSIFDVNTKENINSSDKILLSRKIIIGNHVWIGLRSLILYNTEIGNGSIVGASSLVKGRFPNNCILVGVPARILKSDVAWCRKNRTENILECGEEYINYTKPLDY